MTDAKAARSRLLGATAIMASGTMISRVLGFARAMLVAFALGNMTSQGDIFTLATVVPNNLYMIIAGGTLNAVLVPQVLRHLHADADGGKAYVDRLWTAFLLVLGGLTLVACVFTPQVMSLWMGDVWQSGRLAAHRESLFFLAYLTMPQLFFYGAFFLVSQLLNARELYGPMTWAPILNNIVQIGVLGAYAVVWGSQSDHSVPFTSQQVLLLGIGSTVGIIIQTLALIPALRRVGIRLRPRFDLRGGGLGDTLRQASWAFLYVVIIQLAALVTTRLAGTATVADPANPGPGLLAYNEAYLTWILPHSVFTVSLATAMLTTASRLVAAGDQAAMRDEVSHALKLANTFIVPAAVGLGVLAGPYARLVFGNGAGASDWPAVSLTLTCFAFGLVPYTIQYVYLRAFYALKAMRTVVALQVVISGVNAGLAAGWVYLDPDPATVAPRLALSYSASYLVGALVTYRVLAGRVPGLSGGEMVSHAARALVAVTPGALIAWLATSFASDRGTAVVALAFGASMLVYIVLYVPLARRLGLTEVAEIVGLLTRRLPGRRRLRAADAVPDALAAGQDAPPVLVEGPDAPGAALLEYPDPGAPTDATAGATFVRAGELIEDRYRLDRLLAHRGQALTWLAHDSTLSRAVLIHVLPPGAPRTLDVLDAARATAEFGDARILRVLDATLVEGRPYGAYILCEYAPGQSLELALAQGPLDPDEACWVVREVADALVGMHTRGLFHRHLDPDTVVLTASGNVKVVGFLLESALEPLLDDGVGGEESDVAALGRLLYAGLLGRWPGGAAYGLPAAVEDAVGRPQPLRLAWPELEFRIADVADRLVNPDAAIGTPLATAEDVSVALSAIVGGADSSRELATRLMLPPPLVGGAGRPAGPWRDSVPPATARTTWTPPTLPPTAPPPPVAVPPRPVPAASGGRAALDAPVPDGADEPTRTVPEVGVPSPVPGLGVVPGFDQKPTHPSTPDEYGEDRLDTPVPPPLKGPAVHLTSTTTRPRHLGLKILAGLFGLALVGGLIGVLVSTIQGAGVPTHRPIPVIGVTAFDPKADGGDGVENSSQAKLAADSQASTVWKTETYGKSADFNGRKPGVGLLLDLGSAQKVSSVSVTLTGATDLQVRVPKAADAASPSLTTQADWQPAASATGATGQVTLNLTTPTTTRYVLVYLTKLPTLGAGKGFQGAIAELVVTS